MKTFPWLKILLFLAVVLVSIAGEKELGSHKSANVVDAAIPPCTPTPTVICANANFIHDWKEYVELGTKIDAENVEINETRLAKQIRNDSLIRQGLATSLGQRFPRVNPDDPNSKSYDFDEKNFRFNAPKAPPVPTPAHAAPPKK